MNFLHNVVCKKLEWDLFTSAAIGVITGARIPVVGVAAT